MADTTEHEARIHAEYGIRPDWYRTARSITERYLGAYQWQCAEDQRAGLMTDIACAIRDAIAAEKANDAPWPPQANCPTVLIT